MKIQLESGPSSSATHSLTQPSTTLNRRYVSRPTTLAIEEAAQAARRRETKSTNNAPSRLVNLRLREADIIASQVAMPESSNPPLTSDNNIYIPYDSNLSPEQITPTSAAQPDEITEFALPEADDQISDIRDQIAAELSQPNPAEEVATSSPSPARHYDPETSALALSIAADYTAASLEAAASSSSDHLEETDKLSAAIYAAKNSNPIDEVAQTAASAIAAVRSATTPEDVADRLESLRQFAEQLKSDSPLPEMAELSDTLNNFITIAEKSTGVKAAAKISRAATKAEKSTAKIVKTASAPKTTLRVAKSAPAKPAPSTTKVVLGHNAAIRPAARPAMKAAPAKKANRTTSRSAAPTRRHEADEDKMRRAMRSVATMESNTKAAHRAVHRKGRAKRFALAFSVSAVCIAAIVYFVSSNIPDISVRVAALQTGVEASYPSYVPRDFSLDDISSENGKITLRFKATDGKAFSLIEEKSSWDSTALQRNYVQETWQDKYTTTHEQGITVFINDSSAAWVNGGVLYKINADPGVLTKKQLRNIVTSM